MRAFAVIIALALLLGALALLLGGERDPGNAVSTDLAESSEPPKRTAVVPEPPGAAIEEVQDLRVPAGAAGIADAPDSAIDMPREEVELARLVVHVLAREHLGPVAGVHIYVRDGVQRVWGGVQGSHGKLGEAPRTDASGTVTLEVRSGLQLTVEAGDDGERRSGGSIEVGELAPGEERRVEIAVSTRMDSRLYGRVVAQEDGRPIPGSQIRYQSFAWGSGADRTDPVSLDVTRPPIAIADDRGEFEMPVASWWPKVATLVAPGRGPALILTSNLHESPDQRLEVQLPRSARLRGRFVADSALPSVPVVALETPTYRLTQPAGGLLSGRDVTWRCEVDLDGRFDFVELPPDVPLTVVVRSGEELLCGAVAPLVLEPGEERVIELGGLDSRAVLDGLVLEADGSPAADVEIWLLPRVDTIGGYLHEHWGPGELLSSPLTQGTRSDEDGRFRFEGLAAGEWLLGPAPTDANRDEQQDDATIAPAITRVEIPDRVAGIEVVVRLHRGHSIRGKVIDPVGLGVPGCWVSAWGTDGGGMVSDSTEEDGSFRLGPLVAGRYTLWASAGFSEHLSDCEPLVASTGETGVLLQLRLGGRISGRIIDPVTGELVPAMIWATSLGMLSGVPVVHWDEGTFDFPGLGADTYQLTAITEDGYLGSSGPLVVEPGIHLEGIEIPVELGERVRLRYSGPGDFAGLAIERAGQLFSYDNLEAGVEKTVFAPTGSIAIRLFAYDLETPVFPPPLLFEQERKIQVVRGVVSEVVFEIAVEEDQ